MIYKGASTELIIQPMDSYTVNPNGLIFLARSYCCATTYADTAASTLSVGSAPSGYSTLSLFTKTRKDSNGITTFDCQYYGASGASQTTKSRSSLSYDYSEDLNPPVHLFGRYYSPTWVIEKAVAADADTITAPTATEMGTYTASTHTYTDQYGSSVNRYVVVNVLENTLQTRTNYGAVDVLSKTFILSTSYGA
jgi:hypothetical protein